MVTLEELQEDLCSLWCGVTKWTISNEILNKGLKLQRPKKTSLLLKWQRCKVEIHETGKGKFILGKSLMDGSY